MNFKVHTIGEIEIAEMTGGGLIQSGPAFLEIAMNAPSENIIIHKDQLPESFFELKGGLAGDILQKVSNYKLRLMIVGDFSKYDSKSLRDFIYESNKLKSVGFVGTIDEALEKFQKYGIRFADLFYKKL
jgi:hypothetical protein